MQPTRQQLHQWDTYHVWHSFTQMATYEPAIFDRGEGCEIIDLDGNRYLDGVSSLWCNLHGHRHPKIDAAIIEQLGKVAHVTNLGSSNSTAIHLAKRLTDLCPGELNHVFFAGDGASAVEVALKMAFQYWHQRENPKPEKTVYIGFDDSYHGDTVGTISVGGVDQFNAIFKPLMFPVHRLPIPDRRWQAEGQPHSEAAATEHHLSVLENVLREHHEKIAALVIEPLVLGAAGMVMQPAGYLRGVRELTRRYDVLMIADEIAVGFGRTGKMFACEHEEVVPDMLCLGKGLTGGYLPMSATVATTEIWNAFLGDNASGKTLYHGHTFGGNPLSAAAALATLEIFEEEKTLELLPEKIERLRSHLARMSEHPHVGDVRQCGLIAGIELVADRERGVKYTGAERRGNLACDFARSHQVWIRPLGDVVVIMPPLSISLKQLDQICLAAEAGIDHATR